MVVIKTAHTLSRQIKIVFLNIRNIRNKLDEVKIKFKVESPDILELKEYG